MTIIGEETKEFRKKNPKLKTFKLQRKVQWLLDIGASGLRVSAKDKVCSSWINANKF